MEDKKYNKLKASFEATLPKMPSDFTDRVMKRIDSPVHAVNHRRLWLYAVSSIAAAACIALLFYVGSVRNIQYGDSPVLVAHTDTTKTVPQKETKEVEEQPLQKGKDTEVADSVKIIKEKYRMPRLPKR